MRCSRVLTLRTHSRLLGVTRFISASIAGIVTCSISATLIEMLLMTSLSAASSTTSSNGSGSISCSTSSMDEDSSYRSYAAPASSGLGVSVPPAIVCRNSRSSKRAFCSNHSWMASSRTSTNRPVSSLCSSPSRGMSTLSCMIISRTCSRDAMMAFSRTRMMESPGVRGIVRGSAGGECGWSVTKRAPLAPLSSEQAHTDGQIVVEQSHVSNRNR